MKPAKKRPLDHITPRLSPERVERMWVEIEQAQQPARARWIWVAAAAALLLGVWRMWPAPTLTNAVVTAPTALSLPDGSELRTADATELHVVQASPDEVELALEHGRVRCEVSHRPRKRFAVQVGALTVLVRGTVFTVQAQDHDVRVEVERGLVEVRMREVLLASLSAGQSWSQHAEPDAGMPSPVVQEPDKEDDPEEIATPEPPRKRSKHAVVKESAEALLERASNARLAGDTRSAADLYEQLRVSYPDDPRAGLSAFELARISVHALRDPQRALTALRFALAHGHGFAREDAEVLEVEALALSHDAEGCVNARDRFLRSYLKSAQRVRVKHACD